MRSGRAGLIFIRNKEILLLYRFKNGREYFAFPGGGIEEGETVEGAAMREAKEETGLDIKLGEKLWTNLNKSEETEHYFLVTEFSGGLKLGGPEEERSSLDNIYRLEWTPLDKIKELNLFPEEIKLKVLEKFGI